MTNDNMPEPVAWLVCSVNSDGSLSLEHAAAWEEAAHEHINDAINEHDIADASMWVVRPVVTADQLRAALAAQAEKHAVVVNKCNSYIVDNARLAEANDALRAEVEALRAWVEEAVNYVGCETWSPSLEAEGKVLLAARSGSRP